MARNRGKRLERLLEYVHGIYRTRGQADIHKVEVPTRYCARTKKMIYTKKTGFDFSGTLKGGRTLCMEAKETTGQDRLTIGSKGLKEHQVRALIINHNLNALSGVIWMSDYDHCHWLPGEFLKDFMANHYEKPYKYIPLELVKAKCPSVMMDGFIDYLPAALKEDQP